MTARLDAAQKDGRRKQMKPSSAWAGAVRTSHKAEGLGRKAALGAAGARKYVEERGSLGEEREAVKMAKQSSRGLVLDACITSSGEACPVRTGEREGWGRRLR